MRGLFALVSMSLVACSSVAMKPDNSVVQRPDKVLKAQGYSRLDKLTHLTQKQNQFAREQSAKVDAYRGLAKQVYSEILFKDVLVADQVIKAEPFRVYLDLFLRQATVVKSRVIQDRQFVELRLSLTPRFYHCFSTTVARVSECLQQDDKIQFTRLGYQSALVTTVNLNCLDCSGQLSVAGFSSQKNGLDRTLLSGGLYDAEWIGNMAVSTIIRYWFLTNFIF